MTIDADIARVAKNFGADPLLVQAVQLAEGGKDALIRAVQCSLPTVTTREEALEVTARSANHAMRDFLVQHGHREAFIAFWAARWAPRGAGNDPGHLNDNWPRNVLSAWRDA